MKMLRTIAIVFMGLLAADSLAATPLANHHDNGIIEVKTGKYELSFFPGCMFPFRLKCGGKTLPEPVWLDRVVGNDGKQYFLNVERFAERRILSDTDQEFCIEMSGMYCLNDDVSVPGKVSAVYQYTCRADGVSVNVKISNPEGLQWKELHVFMPGWKNNPWSKYVSDEPARQVDKGGFLLRNKSVSVSNDSFTLTLHGSAVNAYTNPNRKYYSYLAALRCTNWSEKFLEVKDIRLHPFCSKRMTSSSTLVDGFAD